MNKMVRVRFAPSPTGHLHIGSARTALFNYLFAKHEGGSFILRIEDTDRERSADLYEKSILEDLRWLGLNWDEGPEVGGAHGPYYQSQRQKIYQDAASKLITEGKAYFCFCTPDELEAQRQRALAAGKMPKYEVTCFGLSQEEQDRLRSSGRQPTIRFHVPPGKIRFEDMLHGQLTFESEVIGDFIILRSDGTASFNFAVVVDDALMKISHVIRGEDHLPNTPRHVLLCEALGHPLPVYVHHPLVMGKDGGKLSKRHGATSVSEYRKIGYLPEAIINYLSLLGWSSESGREIFRLEELIEEFKLKRLSKSPVIFDYEKLNWINGQHIRNLDPSRLAKMISPYLVDAGFLRREQMEGKSDWLLKVAEAVQSNLVVLADAPEYVRIFFEEKPEFSSDVLEVLKGAQVTLVLQTLKSALLGSKEIDYEQAKELLSRVGNDLKAQGIKGRSAFMPIRAALTGKTSGPELFYVLAIFGKEKCLRRIEEAQRLIQSGSKT